MAYFPASSTFEGILGELYSAAFNGPTFDWICSPAVTELENIVLDWLVHGLNLPESFLSFSLSRRWGHIGQHHFMLHCIHGSCAGALSPHASIPVAKQFRHVDESRFARPPGGLK